MNLLFSFNVFKGFKTILQHTEIKMIEIMANCERSYLVCNVTKNAKKHIQKCNQKMKRIAFLLQRKVHVIKKKQV